VLAAHNDRSLVVWGLAGESAGESQRLDLDDGFQKSST